MTNTHNQLVTVIADDIAASNSDIATDFLRAICAGAEAPIVANESGVETVFDEQTSINSLSADSVIVLATMDGKCLGLVAATDDVRVTWDIESLGQPSIAVASGYRIALVYLLDEPVDGDRLEALDKLVKEKGCRSALDQCCPIPGVGDAWFARDQDEEAISHDLVRFNLEELHKRFAKWAGSLGRLPIIGKVHDAILFGEFTDPNVLTHEMKLGFARGCKAPNWKSADMTVNDFIALLARHEEGQKDGKAFLQGEAIDGQRKRNSMRVNYVAGLDIDNGTSIESVLATVESLGVTAVIYSTHSHLKPQSKVGESAYSQWAKKIGASAEPTIETIGAYLLAVGKITPELTRTITTVRREHTSDGVQFFVDHAPMPRFRIVFPLLKPFVFAERWGSHADVMKEWADRIRALGKLVNVSIDESCTDPSRLFFLPRHVTGAEHVTYVLLGNLLDFDALQIVGDAGKLPAAKRSGETIVAKAAKHSHDHRKPWITKNGTDLFVLGDDWRENFDLASAIERFAPDAIRENKGDKLLVDCPFDSYHSDPGNSDDRACMVANPSANSTGKGFVFTCQHNACKSRTKLEMLCEALDQDWFEEAVLFDPEFARKPAVQIGSSKASISDTDAPLSAGDMRVLIVSTEDHSVAVKKALNALKEANAEQPRLFNVAGGLARLVRDQSLMRLKIELLTSDLLRYELGRSIAWMVPKGEKSVRETRVPDHLSRDILANDDNGLPVLNGIVHTPFFVRSENGPELVATPGYHHSGCYYDPTPGLQIPVVSSAPSEDEIERAKELLFENVFRDFPFDDDIKGNGSRAHALALLLQFFMRDLIDGPTPIYFVNKPMAGTGAGLLIECIMLIATGQGGHAQTESSSEEERRKSITASLMNGSSYYWLDNINRELSSSAFASAVTSTVWRDRVLGRSEIVNFPVRLAWIFAGNNMSASHEMVRRFVPIRLDAKGDPLDRDQDKFKHRYLRGWVREHRGELIWACLTIVQHWIALGVKRDQTKPRDSFEDWSAVFRGLLSSIGVAGFLGNLDILKDGVNEEMDAWQAFIGIWATKDGVGVKRIVGNPDGGDEPQQSDPFACKVHGENSLVSIIEKASLDISIKGNDGTGKARSLSAQLRNKQNNAFSVTVDGQKRKMSLHSEMDTNLHQKVFWLELLE
jgi:hypothetical protein